MAIAANNPQTTRSTTNTNSYTLSSYAVPSGSDRVLVVTLSLLRSNENTTTPNGVTFGGNALTQVVTVNDTSSNRAYHLSVWRLINPTVSTADIVADIGVSMAGAIVSAVTLTGVDQTTPVTGYGTASVTGDYIDFSPTGSGGHMTYTGSAGAAYLFAVTTNAAGNPVWDWDGFGTEHYNLNNGSSNNNEVAGSGVYGTGSNPTATCSTSPARTIGLAVGWKEAAGGPVTVALNTLSAAASAVSLAVVPGAVSTLLDTLSAALSGVTLSVAPGATSVTLDTLTSQLTAQTLAVVPGGVAIVLTTLEADASTPALDVVPGETFIALNTLTGALTAVQLVVTVDGTDVTVVLASLPLVAEAVSLAVVPGEVVIDLATLAALLSAVGVEISTDILPQIIALSTLSLTAETPSLVVVPGEVAIELQTLVANLTVIDLTVFLMLGCALAADRLRYGAIAADGLRWYATASDRDGCA